MIFLIFFVVVVVFFVGDVIQPQIHSVQDLIKMSHKSTGWQSMANC